jgi:glycosyltransferase involved in cell wall biosynthesis
VREVIRDGDNGLLCDHQDPDSLAEAIARLLRDDGLAQKLATTARREAVERYGRTRMNAQYENLFRELVT